MHPTIKGWRLIVATGLLSMGALSLEIILTRIFSILYSYNYVFLIVSLSVMAMGLGGALALIHGQTSTKSLKVINISSWPGLASGFGISIILLAAACTILLPPLAAIIPLAMLPFFMAGGALAIGYTAFRESAPGLYAADLAGAAAAAVLTVWILNHSDASLALLFPASTGASALVIAAPFAHSRTRVYALLAVLLTMVVGFAAFSAVSPATIQVSLDPDKDMARILADQKTYAAQTIESRSSAFGRTDLVAIGTRPQEMQIFIDGAAGSIMYAFQGDLSRDNPVLARLKQSYTGFFPFLFVKPHQIQNVLVIGAGAGQEVLLALGTGASRVIAVEVNPDLVKLVQEHKDFNGGLYNGFPGVQVVVNEGRHYLRSTGAQFDAIVLALPVTKSSRSYEGFGLTENFLLTKESIGEYWDHLSSTGQLVIVAHNHAQSARLVVTSLATLAEKGLNQQDAMQHLYTVGTNQFPVFVLRKEPIKAQESDLMTKAAMLLGYDVGYAYIPGYTSLALKPDAQYYEKLANGKLSPEEFASLYAYNIQPATDDRPFFYWIYKKLPSPVQWTLGISLAALLLVLGLPLAFKASSRSRPDWVDLLQAGFYAGVLGMAFMLAEIVLIQWASLFLGQPVHALALSLASLLAGMSLGSGLGSHFVVTSEHRWRRLAVICLLIGVSLGSYSLALPKFWAVLSGASLPVRSLAVAIVFALLGGLLGVPFPQLLRFSTSSWVPAWCYATNGVAGVVGSALAQVLGMRLGFSYAWGLAIGLYIGLALTMSRWRFDTNK